MSALLQDLKYGLRVLVKNPGFTAVAVLTLALGIGANTSIFSLIEVLMLRPLPVKNPRQLVILHRTHPNNEDGGFTYDSFKSLRNRNRVFAGMFAYDNTSLSVGVKGQTEMASGRLVSGEYFSVLGVDAVAGRTFDITDDLPGAAPVAVISYAYWQRRFALDRSILGATVTIRGTPFTLIGVTPPEFFGLSPDDTSDVTVPMVWHRELGLKDHTTVGIMARRELGVSSQQAEVELNVLYQQMLQEETGSQLSAQIRRRLLSRRIRLEPGARGEGDLREEYSRQLFTLLGMMGLVLLIACANVANLLLARASARQREIAVRLALGVGRGRLVRQLLTESLLLAVLAGIFGLMLAFWGTDVLQALLEVGKSSVLAFHPNAYVLAFTAALSIATGILFGLAPAVQASRLELTPALKNAGRQWEIGSRGSRRSMLGRGLVALQVALCLVVLSFAGLLVRSLKKLSDVRVRFNRQNVLLFMSMTTVAGYEGPQEISLYDRLREYLNALPCVQSASLSRYSFLGGRDFREVSIPGYSPPPNQKPLVSFNAISPGFFRTMQLRLLEGREFSARDSAASTPAAIVNRAFAERYFAGQSALSRHISLDGPQAAGQIEIVGIVEDAAPANLLARDDRPREEVYVPIPQAPAGMLGQMTFEVRTSSDPRLLAPAVIREIHTQAKDLPLVNFRTQGEQIIDSHRHERALAQLSGIYGMFALVLACLGMYGVTSYAIAARTPEFGIRMALGAPQRGILWMVLRDALVLVAGGVALGLPATLGTTRLVSGLLFGLDPTDPVTLATVSLALALVAALAAYIPARRATKVDPMVALRYE